MLGKLRPLSLIPCAASVAKLVMTPCDRTLSSCTAAEDSRAKTNTPMKNKIVLITGATAGIGKACAWRFAEEGSKLILVGRREDRLVELQKALQQSYKGIRVHLEALDVRDTDKVAKLPAKLPEEFQNVDILVNNAGLALGVTLVESNSVEDAKTMLDTNVLGFL
jgi:3-hydroxy acid dehydrogenase/malonic semialdehyde reductase